MERSSHTAKDKGRLIITCRRYKSCRERTKAPRDLPCANGTADTALRAALPRTPAKAISATPLTDASRFSDTTRRGLRAMRNLCRARRRSWLNRVPPGPAVNHLSHKQFICKGALSGTDPTSQASLGNYTAYVSLSSITRQATSIASLVRSHFPSFRSSSLPWIDKKAHRSTIDSVSISPFLLSALWLGMKAKKETLHSDEAALIDD